MYIQKGKRIQSVTIQKAILKTLKELGKSHWGKGLYQKLKHMTMGDIRRAANALKELNDALLDGRSVFAVCDKYPPGNLDTGSHHFSIYYITKEGKTCCFWAGPFMEKLGANKNKMESGLKYFTFRSGVIGMSRVLDATDGVFTYLRSIGGCYAQIEIL